MIELAAADAVADRVVVNGLDFPAPADESRAESRDWLQRPSTPIFRSVNFQFVHDARRNPARTDFVAWEDRGVHHDDIEARLPQFPRAGRSRRPTAHDQYVAGLHVW